MLNKRQQRTLGIDEVKRIVASSEYAKKEAELSRAASKAWPGAYNLRLLAEAVSTRRTFVTFDNAVRFKISYYTKLEKVFIKPADGGYVPCGYFGYEKLKQLMVTAGEDGDTT